MKINSLKWQPKSATCHVASFWLNLKNCSRQTMQVCCFGTIWSLILVHKIIFWSWDVICFVYYFAAFSQEYEREILLSNGPFPTVFSVDVCQLHSRHNGKFIQATERETIFDQTVANLPLNDAEDIRFLKTFEIRVFFWKIDGFLTEKFDFSPNSQMWHICCRIRIN